MFSKFSLIPSPILLLVVVVLVVGKLAKNRAVVLLLALLAAAAAGGAEELGPPCDNDEDVGFANEPRLCCREEVVLFEDIEEDVDEATEASPPLLFDRRVDDRCMIYTYWLFITVHIIISPPPT